MPKLLLIQPSQYACNGGIIRQKKLYLPGLVFPLLAAMAPEQWEIEVKIEVIENIDFDTDADLIGIGCMGHSIFRGFDLADEFRKRGKTVFMGGYMASMLPGLALEHADSLVIGDAEISFPKLLQDFETKGTLERTYHYPVNDLQNLPVPRYEILTRKSIGDMLPVQAGRGCNHTCSFCSIACLYKGRYLPRPADEVIRDIIRIKSLGFKKFYLIDDNIVSNPAYLEEICERIKPLNMKWSSQCTLNLAKHEKLLKLVAGSGCEILSVGVESITQEGLDRMDKKWLYVSEHEELVSAFNRAGIMLSAEMMIGTDSDTPGSIRATWEFIRKVKFPLLRIYILTPVPGTRLYSDLKHENRLLHENFREYTAANCVHIPLSITPEELQKAYSWLNKKVFSIHGILNRTLLNRNAPRNPDRYLFAFFTNLHYRSYVRRDETPLIV